MALAATSVVFELATLSSLAVVVQGSNSSCGAAHGLRQQGSVQGLKLQEQLHTRRLASCGRRRFRDGVLVVASQDGNIRDEEVRSSSKRSFMLTTAMTLAGAMIITGAVASSSADAAIQKVEGTERGEQDTVTTGIREKSMLSTGKGNTIRELPKQTRRHLGVQFKECQSWNHQEVLTSHLKAEPKLLMKQGARNQHLLAFSRNVQLHPGPRERSKTLCSKL